MIIIYNPEVTTFIAKLDPELGELVQAIRTTVLGVNPAIGEIIKWNSPCYVYNGIMKPFNPKEYTRDILVIHTRKNIATLIFPTGAIIEDESGFLSEKYTDGRRIGVIKNLNEWMTYKSQLEYAIINWISKIEK